MKKTRLIFGFALVLASCTIDRSETFDPEIGLAFQPAMYRQMDGGRPDGYPQDLPFGVSIWLNAGGTNASLLEDAQVNPGKDLWSCSNAVLWPARGTDMSVVAYSPFGRAAKCSSQDGVVFAGVDVSADQTDLLYCDAQSGLEKMACGGVVSVPFKHALCQISFRVYNCVERPEKIELKRLSIRGAYCKGDFHSLQQPQWQTSGDKCQFVFFEGLQTTASEAEFVGKSILMVPQTLDTVIDVEFEYYTTGGTHITQDIESTALKTALKPGFHYIYTVGIGIDEVHFQTELIEHRFRKN